MTGAEFQRARLKLGVAGAPLAKALFVAERTLRGWEAGARGGKPVVIPPLVALVMRRALKDPSLRRELGIDAREVKGGAPEA
jgi:hypothetical protein